MTDTAETTPADGSQPELPGPESLESADPAGAPQDDAGQPAADAAPESIEVDATTPAAGGPAPPPSPDKKSGRFRRLRRKFNVYLLLFGFIILVAVSITLVAYLQSRQTSKTNRIPTQNLSQSTLEQLANGDVTVGSGQSVLNVQSSAVFAGQVLIRQNLEVAGNLQIGGTVALSNIAVAGTSQLGQVTVNKDLSVAGDTAVQGAITIAKSLQVGGGGNFGGTVSAPQIATPSLQLNGDLVLTHHITTGGGTPGRSDGSALGSGGSASVSGSDTAGSININTGGSPAAGCFVTINFTAKYNATPHVVVTPIGSAAGGLSYYVNRSSTSFSVCDATPPPAGASFGFDYFVVD